MVVCVRASPSCSREAFLSDASLGAFASPAAVGPARVSTGFRVLARGGTKRPPRLDLRVPRPRLASGKERCVNFFESEFDADDPEHIPGMLFWEDEPFSVRAGLPAGPGVPLRVLRVEIRIDLVRLGLGFRRRDRRCSRRQARAIQDRPVMLVALTVALLVPDTEGNLRVGNAPLLGPLTGVLSSPTRHVIPDFVGRRHGEIGACVGRCVLIALRRGHLEGTSRSSRLAQDPVFKPERGWPVGRNQFRSVTLRRDDPRIRPGLSDTRVLLPSVPGKTDGDGTVPPAA
jgi:hypothetical protein